MRTLNVGLSSEAIAARRHSIGGSDANVLMSGDEAAIMALWEQKTGRCPPPDLSDVLPVAMGSWTEELNRYWFEKNTGRLVTCEGTVCHHSDYTFITCTLDGLTTTADGRPAVFEAKHCNAFAKMADIEQRYMPQLHHNMAVCGVEFAVLSVFVGTQVWELTEVEVDQWYLAELIDREKAFWQAVQDDTPPPFLAPVAPPVAPDKWRKIDMTGSNEWASLAIDWRQNRAAAKAFTSAEKAIKGLMEADVGEARGHGIVCKRSRNGALRISEEAA